MVWIADEVEGGEKTIFGRCLNTTGLSSSMDLIDLVERAFSQSGAYEPTPCRNFFPLPEKNQAGYKPINPKTMIGTVEMVPVNGCAFASHDYDYGTKMYPSKHTRVESYPHRHRELSKSLGTKLRHRIGRQWKSGRMGPVKCDDGAWVDWEDIVTDNYIWHDGHWDDRSIPIGVRKARLEIFFTQNFECFRTSKRTRFQMLAVRIDPQIHDRSDDPAISMFIPELLQKGCTKARLDYTEGWAHPVAVRATSAHSTDGGGYDVVIDPDKIGARLTNTMAAEVSIAYHSTTFNNLESIMRSGLVPGGVNSQSGRRVTHFAAFPPWAQQDRLHDKPWMGRALRWYENPVVLATHVLTLQEYGLHVNAQGAFTVENIVPFEEIRGAWVYRNVKPAGVCEMYAWQRLILRDPEPGSYIVSDYHLGDPAMRPEFSRLEKLVIDTLNLEVQQNNELMHDLVSELDEICEPPPYGERLWCLLIDEIARIRALNDTDTRICPHSAFTIST